MTYDKNEINKMAMKFWLTDNQQEKALLRDMLAEEGLKVCRSFMYKMSRPDDRDTLESCANLAIVKSIDAYSPKMLYVNSETEYEVKDGQQTFDLYTEQKIVPYSSFCNYLLTYFKYLYSKDRADERYAVLSGYMQPYKKLKREEREQRDDNPIETNNNTEDHENEFGISLKGELYKIQRVLSLNKVVEIGENNETEMGEFLKSPNAGPETEYKSYDQEKFLNAVYRKLNYMKMPYGKCYSGLNMSVVANIYEMENGFISENDFKKVFGVYKILDPMFIILTKKIFTLIKKQFNGFPLSEDKVQELKTFINNNYRQYIEIDPESQFGSRPTILCKLLILELLDSYEVNVNSLNEKRSTYFKVGEMYGVSRQRIEQELKGIIKYLNHALAGVAKPDGSIIEAPRDPRNKIITRKKF